MKKLILLFLFTPAVTLAAPPQFYCFNAMAQPPQVYEYMSANLCGKEIGSSETLGKKGTDGKTRPVLCSYGAMCAIKEADLKKPEDNPTLFFKRARTSFLVCQGEASFTDGIIDPSSIKCPPLDDCQQDLAFNGVLGKPQIGPPESFSVPKENQNPKVEQ